MTDTKQQFNDGPTRLTQPPLHFAAKTSFLCLRLCPSVRLARVIHLTNSENNSFPFSILVMGHSFQFSTPTLQVKHYDLCSRRRAAMKTIRQSRAVFAPRWKERLCPMFSGHGRSRTYHHTKTPEKACGITSHDAPGAQKTFPHELHGYE